MLHDLKQNTELRRNPTMANIQKYKRSEVGHLCAHYERSASNYSNTDIDLTRTADNYNLAPDHSMSQTAYIKQALDNIHHATAKHINDSLHVLMLLQHSRSVDLGSLLTSSIQT